MKEIGRKTKLMIVSVSTVCVLLPSGPSLGGSLDASSSAAVALAQESRNIRFGEIVIESISLTEEMDRFTFNANAGDAIIIRAVQCIPSTILNPFRLRIRLFDEFGQLLDQNDGPVSRIGPLRVANGTFSISVSDVDDDATGQYTLFLQRVNNPGSAQPLIPGDDLLVFLNNCGEVDTYTFSARIGDRVRVFMAGGDVGSIDPFLELYDNEGRAIAIVPGANEPPEARIDQILPSSGTFTLLAEDSSRATGTYSISLLLLPAQPRMINLPLVQAGQAPEGIRQTTFILANTFDTTARGILEFVAPDGATPLEMTIRGTTDSLFPLAIPFGGVRILETEVTTPLAQGFARITMDTPVRGTVILRSADESGRIIFETSYGTPTPTRTLTSLANSLGDDTDTGLVILNPNADKSAEVSLQLIDSNGQRVSAPVIRSIDPGMLSLSSNGEVIQFMSSDFFPLVPGVDEFEGTISITSSAAISVLTIQKRGDQLTIVPTL